MGTKRASLLAILLLLLPSWAEAAYTVERHVICGEYKQIRDRLEGVFRESPIAMGMGMNGSVVEVLRSKEGTFTVLVSFTVGKTVHACVAASGDGYEDVEWKDPEGPET